MNFSRRRSKRGVVFDMTPMIDVVMQLLIFFMFTNQLASMVRSPVDLPREQGDEEAATRKPTMVIDIRADGMLLVDSRPVSRADLTQIIKAEVARVGDAAKIDVLVRADRNGPAKYLNDVARELRRQGVRTLPFGVQEPEGRR
jgi:biopolymer transport protein ExbD